jgi:hypothetical protein
MPETFAVNTSVDTGEQPGVDDAVIEAGDYREESSTRMVPVETTLYESARLIAELRGESVDDVVARALRSYARGRRRPRD